MIDIRETDNEFLLFIPAPQKDRARSIAGYRWNPNRRCWVYPKTPHHYDALLAEFRHELPAITVPRPAAADWQSSPADGNALAAENQTLRDEIATLRRTVAELRAGASADPSRGNATVAAAWEREVAKLRARLAEAETEARRAIDEAAGLKGQSSDGHAVAPVPQDDHQRFIAFFRGLAVEAAGKDRTFATLAKAMTAPDTFPAMIAAELESSLRRLLALDDPTVALTELIMHARATGRLSPDAADLAAVIANQPRAPRSISPAVTWARCLLALYAAALLWPELQVP